MAGAAIVAAAQPAPRHDPQRQPLHLDSDVPRSFGPWSEYGGIAPLALTPETASRLEKIYNQQLIRSYRNTDGRVVMLLIAYGEDQLELTTQVHMPDVCYPAQGFDIVQRKEDSLAFGRAAIPVVRLFARSPGRDEPITYWITMGDAVLQNEMQRRFARLRYALRGIIPDGMLVRVSSLDSNVERAWVLQDSFLVALFAELATSIRGRLFGAAAASAAAT